MPISTGTATHRVFPHRPRPPQRFPVPAPQLGDHLGHRPNPVPPADDLPHRHGHHRRAIRGVDAPRRPGRDQVSPQAARNAAAALGRGAGISDPLSEVDVAEIYVPFSWFEPMRLGNLGFAA